MALSRRRFVRVLAGGAGALSTASIIGRGSEELFALGLQRAPMAAGTIKISSNENPRGPSPKALEALSGRVSPKVGRYPDNDDLLVETIAGIYGATPENVLISTGSGGELTAAVRAYCSPTRPLVNGHPSYSSPDRTAQRIDAQVKHIPLKADLRLDLDAMAEASRGAGLVFVCNPNNPTSTIHSKPAIADFVARVRSTSPETGILIDEAYIDYAAEAGSGTSAALALEHPNVFITRTFSKAYGMAGLRLGYAVGQPQTLQKLADAWGLGSVNALTAAAGIAALQDTAHMEKERQENKRVRDFTLAAFREMGFEAPDSNTNFIFVNIRRPAKDFREACAARGVLVGRDFPPMEKTHARISIGTMEEMEQAVQVFREVLGVATTSA